MVWEDIYFVAQAWERAGGECEDCRKRLVWLNRGEKTDGAWEALHKTGKPDSVANCVVLCHDCYSKAKRK
ncbi:MAG: hypothetical protein V1932_05235 [Chloroflexota bacterium]